MKTHITKHNFISHVKTNTNLKINLTKMEVRISSGNITTSALSFLKFVDEPHIKRFQVNGHFYKVTSQDTSK